MIFVVDDEEVHLTLIRKALEGEGFVVEAFTSAADVLKRLAAVRPELIISDVLMPDMGGFEFKAALDESFSDSSIPFVFLSSEDDADHIVRGLEADADDYLLKPINPRILGAKVRAILSRRQRSAYRGDLRRFPFIKVVQFCEHEGFTGEVEFSGPGCAANVRFRGGEIVLDELDEVDGALSRLYDLTEGSFLIRNEAVDFSRLEGLAAPVRPVADPQPLAADSQPMGKLSAVQANDRQFQIQTELATHPEPEITTVVILDGNTVLTRRVSPPEGADRVRLEQSIEVQHQAVEQEVRERIEALAKKKTEPEPSPSERFYELFEAGLDAYRARRFTVAVDLWTEAKALNPADRALDINLRIAREKIELESG